MFKAKKNNIKKIILNSNLFDKIFYLKENKDARLADKTPIDHYCQIGIKEDRKPNQFFHPAWYREHYEDIKKDGANPFIHYILFGRAENRFRNEKESLDYTTLKESNLFDEKYYLEQNKDVKEVGIDPILHFVRIGYTEGRRPNQAFNPAWYKEHYEDIKADGMSPFIHYILFGRAENRFRNKKESLDYTTIKESNLFDEKYYLEQNEDIKEAGIDPLLHFIRIGHTESRQPNSSFHPAWYREYYEDIKADGISPFIHYILFGRAENRFINEKEYSDYITIKESNLFDKKYYLEQNEDVKEAEIDTLLHFVRIGHIEDRKPNQAFSPVWYREHYEDIKKDGMNPFIHYILFGRAENRFINEQEYSNYETVGTSSGDFELNIIDPAQINISSNKIIKVPTFNKPLVSIIIPVYNQVNYTLACVQSIVNNTANIPYEIIIMDDKSSDEDAQNLKDYIKNITFISNKENLGFLLNCNKGAQLAQGKYILFLNNDTNVQADWLTSLVELIKSDEKIGMVGSRLVYPSGRQQEAGGIIWNDASGWNFGRLDNPMKPEYNYVKEVDYISGASIMISKALWKEIDGFDERFVPAYYEDVDLAFEVRKRGYKVIYQPKSVVIHFEGVSNGTDLGSGMKRYQVINHEKFLAKWKDILQKEYFPNAVDTFLARDCSRNKKTLLFIDHYVPHFDQDAGSKATLHYLDLFIKNNINVKFLGDNFYNYPETPYVSTLEQMGIEVLCGVYYAQHWENWLKENGQYLDYVVLSRPHISEKYIDIVKRYTNAKIIYFPVDLHYLREEREYKVKKDKKILESSINWKEREFNIMRKSDIVCCYSYVEVNEIKLEDPTINAIAIPLYIYNEFPETSYIHSERRDIMFVGGFTHTPNVDAVEWFIEEVMPSIRKMDETCKLYIIGSNVTEKIQRYADEYEDIIVTGRVSDEELANYYQTCRLAIAPLRYGAGVKGKVVESLYNNIPLVTTSIGAEGLINVEDNLIIANNISDFSNSVIEIYRNKLLAEKLSNESIKYCKQYFSLDSAEKSIFKNGLNLIKNKQKDVV